MTSVSGSIAPLAAGSPRHLPGEVGIWILVGGDLLIFTLLFGAFLVARGEAGASFAQSQGLLDSRLATLNTCLLLTSSRCIAGAVRCCRSGDTEPARRQIGLAMMCGFAFVATKAIEYRSDFAQGLTLSSNDFFMFYYVITGLHLAHVLLGLGFLHWLTRRSGRDRLRDVRIVEVGATFWHFVDVVWVIIFPLIYLAN